VTWLEVTCLGALLLAGFSGATWLHLVYWTRRYAIARCYDETHEFVGPDGVALRVHRYRPRGVPSSMPPILACHGLGATHRNLDLDDSHSLALHLAEAGRDVWLGVLRSGRRDLGYLARRRIDFDSMARADVPGLVAFVRARTGAAQIDWIGYSMGGMLLYAALGGRTIAPGCVRKVAILASPARFGVPFPGLAWVGSQRWVGLLDVPFGVLGRLFAFAARRFRVPLEDLVLNPANIAPERARYAMVEVVNDIPGPLQRSFARFARLRRFVSLDGLDYLDGLRSIDIPVTFWAGDADKLAPARAIQPAFEAWGADNARSDKKLVRLGRAHGQHEDYGHGDIAFGDRAVEEVYRPVEAWLAA